MSALKWEPRGLVLVGREVQPPHQAPVRAADVTALIACPTCRARVNEVCRTTSGHTTTPHGSRLAPRLCRCGSRVDARRTYCDTCRDQINRENKRDYLRRRRAGLRTDERESA